MSLRLVSLFIILLSGGYKMKQVALKKLANLALEVAKKAKGQASMACFGQAKEPEALKKYVK